MGKDGVVGEVPLAIASSYEVGDSTLFRLKSRRCAKEVLYVEKRGVDNRGSREGRVLYHLAE